MKKVAKFEKVSFEEFSKSVTENSEKTYTAVILPKRATVGSAGYDFFAPFDFRLEPNQTITVPTGIRVKIDDGWVLKIYPRSSLGFKYRLRLDNTTGIIDSDYYYAKNEGHIFVRLTNCSFDKTLEIKQGDAFAQGIFCEYGITYDDDVSAVRTGGIGSTNK